MARRSPTLEGFKAVFAQPFLLLAEISWRWTLGFCGILLLCLTAVEHLNSIPVNDNDLLLLNSGQRFLIVRGLLHAFQGSGGRLFSALLLVMIALAIAWVVAGALGREACLRALVERFRGSSEVGSVARFQFAPLMALNVLRVVVMGAAVLGCLGAKVLITRIYPALTPGRTILALMALVFQVWLAWSIVNWILSTASIFVVRDGEETLAALASTVEFIRCRTGSLLAVGSAFGAAHLLVFAWTVAASLAMVALGRGSSPAAVLFGGILISLVYFVAADILYVGRMAAYVFILEIPESALLVPAMHLTPIMVGGSVVQSSETVTDLDAAAGRVDQDEVILSDRPLLRPPGEHEGSAD